jgi:hypothetical protein
VVGFREKTGAHSLEARAAVIVGPALVDAGDDHVIIIEHLGDITIKDQPPAAKEKRWTPMNTIAEPPRS